MAKLSPLDVVKKNILKQDRNGIRIGLHEVAPISPPLPYGMSLGEVFEGLNENQIRELRNQKYDDLKKYTDKYGVKEDGSPRLYDYDYSDAYRVRYRNALKDYNFVRIADDMLDGNDEYVTYDNIGLYPEGPVAPKNWTPTKVNRYYKYSSLPEQEVNSKILDFVNGMMYDNHKFTDKDGFVTLPDWNVLHYKDLAKAYMKMHDAGLVKNRYNTYDGTVNSKSLKGRKIQNMTESAWDNLTPRERMALAPYGQAQTSYYDTGSYYDTMYFPVDKDVDYENTLDDFLKSLENSYDKHYNYSYGSLVKRPSKIDEFYFGSNMSDLNHSFRDRIGNSTNYGEDAVGRKYWGAEPYDYMQRYVDNYVKKK